MNMKTDRFNRYYLSICLLYLFYFVPSHIFSQTDDPYSLRRESVMTKIGLGIAILPSEHQGQSGSRASKNFYYLTGRSDPKTVLVITPNSEQKEVLFLSSRQRENKESSSNIEIRPLEKLKSFLYPLLYSKDTFYIPYGDIGVITELLGSPGIFSDVKEIENLDPIINEMRLIKSADELLKLQKAIDITAMSLNEAIRAAAPGMRELDLQAIMHYIMNRMDAKEGFTQVASGPNSTFIHFDATDRKMESGDVIIFDFGVYYNEYIADISRTIPVSGRFTPEQRDIYNIVLRAQKEGIDLMKPGSSYPNCEKQVENVLADGLHRLGLVTDTSIVWQRKLYILHGFSHGIGLDIHDVYQHWQKRPMEEKLFWTGMIYTMEPGLYFPRDMLDSIPQHIKGLVHDEEFASYVGKVKNIYMKYANTGVRIEDDVLITETGNKVLSLKVPSDINAIEKLMKEPSINDVFRR
jgi:Xaa-Pro aminopeptidase